MSESPQSALDEEEQASRSSSAEIRDVCYKTVICKYWASCGGCQRTKCPYAHGEADLRPRKDLTCTQICRFGTLCQREGCRYAHGEEELQRGVVRAPESSPGSCVGRSEEGSPGLATAGSRSCDGQKPSKADAYSQGIPATSEGDGRASTVATKSSCVGRSEQGSPGLATAGSRSCDGQQPSKADASSQEIPATSEGDGRPLTPPKKRPRGCKRKTKLCEHYKAGECKKGDECDYAHGKEELRPVQPRKAGGAWKAPTVSPRQGGAERRQPPEGRLAERCPPPPILPPAETSGRPKPQGPASSAASVEGGGGGCPAAEDGEGSGLASSATSVEGEGCCPPAEKWTSRLLDKLSPDKAKNIKRLDVAVVTPLRMAQLLREGGQWSGHALILVMRNTFIDEVLDPSDLLAQGHHGLRRCCSLPSYPWTEEQHRDERFNLAPLRSA